MGRGTLTAVAGLALSAMATASCSDRRPGLAAGTTLPPAWLADGSPIQSPAGTRLVWVFRTSDCLSCQSIDYVVRRLNATHGDSLHVLAIHIGDRSGRSVVDRFVTGRRVALDGLITISPRVFSRHFRTTGLPALLVIGGDRVEWSSAIPQGVTGLTQIDSVVRAVSARVPQNGSVK